jgi:hypothetical protein
LAALLSSLRQFPLAEQAYDRAIELAPDQPELAILKAHVNLLKTGVDAPLRAAIAALPGSMADDRNILTVRLWVALSDRDWQKARELLEKMKGGQDEGEFGYAGFPVPINCYLILIDRLQGNRPSANPSDQAVSILAPLAKLPCGVYYGTLKLDPLWDPLRKDPRFERLLAELAPKD